jgi:ankyrin repeat protein
MKILALIFVMLVGIAGAAFAGPLHVAAEMGDVAKVKSLLAAGADVNARDEDGDTPLHFAARMGSDDEGAKYSEVARVLIAAGATGSIQNKEGKTAFDVASDKLKQTDPELYWRLNDLRYAK